MKSGTTSLILLWMSTQFTASNCIRMATESNPVSRIVSLMQSLSAKLENEMKKEKDMYETYQCWASSVVSQKEASNSKANSRITELSTYISDIEAGKVEFTTEREELQKELKDVSAEIETATLQRTSQNQEFVAAETEMKQAITALESAIDVLKQATSSSLLGVKATVNEGFQERIAEAQNLERAVEVGRRYLSKGNARFLEHVLTGQVPDVDWKKVNRKATFKMAYTKRSGEIQQTLADLLETFKANLQEATEKEEAAVATHTTLMTSKGAQKKSAEEALAAMDVENGARGKAKSEAQAEIDFLQDQVKNDNQVITDTRESSKIKADEYKARTELQEGELAAFSQAISILHSDDARDLFKKSFKSQGYMFMQMEQRRVSRALSEQLGDAAAAIRAAGRKSGDKRLGALATGLARLGGRSSAPIDKSLIKNVITQIDNMLANLKAEEASDLAKKEDCEKTHAENSAELVKKSRTMDDTTRDVRRNKAIIIELDEEIKDKKKQISEIQEDIKEATENRNAEHDAWTLTDADDTSAASLVKQATDVLKNFYKDSNLQFLQRDRQPVTVEAGKAPPPPPETWEGAYMGATGEKNGIIAILEMVHSDILKDQETAKAAEVAAEAEYGTFKQESEGQISDLNDAVDGLVTNKAGKATEIVTWNTERTNLKDEVGALLKADKDAAPGCDFMTVNFKVRTENRHLEIDGLNKAKTILSSLS